MPLLTGLIDDGLRIGGKGVKGTLGASSGFLRKTLANVGLLGAAGVGYAVAVPALEGATGRDLPGGPDTAGEIGANVGDAAGNLWGGFTGSFAGGTAKGLSTGLTSSLGLPPGTGALLLLVLGGVLIVGLIKK